MIENTKCECGHNNPVGTILCEYCGKPLDESIKDKQTIEQEMRYEGKARRSQTFDSTLFDRVWNFFSSVKVAIVLILITLVAAGIGTIFPQEQFIRYGPPEVFYSQEYGVWGELFYKLGLSDMYSSWWFFLLLAMIGVSLVICSLDRVIPLYRALKNQKVIKNTDFISRQRISHQEEVLLEHKDQKLDQLAHALQKKFYHVRRDGDALLAEKGRISRWGPYINHIGLIIFLFGVILRYIPGWYLDESMWIREGEVKRVPETEYYVKNARAFAEMYDQKEIPQQSGENGQVVKKYQTDAILYKKDGKTGKLKPVHKQSILVNHPLEYQGLSLFQSGLKPEVDSITLKVTEKKTKREQGKFTVDLYNIKPDHVYPVGGNLEVRVLEYYPDFALEDHRPVTKSQTPNRPAFIFEVKQKGQSEGERSWVISGLNFENPKTNQYDIDLSGLNTVNSSALMVRVDKSLPVIFFGGIISMIGLVMGFYWQHRRVWVRWKDGVLFVGAHTNKNWFSLRRELQLASRRAELKLQLVKE
ncbi:cytochrome c biogenesis protein ResB [Paenactinomyces guangxiensis]|uniref:Cytochrome c biogenesis protein ResB n=1 Tax=Paenactinomyces guangxiensis TaxID=1490290 RepID=A0A7W2A9X3_9BACL|nr:cytochrome c biogenesis protein ResB [Paenactinomyces guangxiensis]MBA4495647.1 cytochrome c biogenesis protein ResB [Paenactinomyces guangxiensis]MBH8592635.1 cytochrome c biogenesis protein ResB [Paenactinomyces guangxiensis]